MESKDNDNDIASHGAAASDNAKRRKIDIDDNRWAENEKLFAAFQPGKAYRDRLMAHSRNVRDKSDERIKAACNTLGSVRDEATGKYLICRFCTVFYNERLCTPPLVTDGCCSISKESPKIIIVRRRAGKYTAGRTEFPCCPPSMCIIESVLV